MSSVATLRAMAVNYANGHNWDHLDTEACIKAAAEIEQLTKQRDELLTALEKFMDAHEECTDFDGYTAHIVSMDDYHEAQDTIASAKGGAA